MLCKYCGKAMSATATVCPFCGSPVVQTKPGIVSTEKPAPEKSEPEKAARAEMLDELFTNDAKKEQSRQAKKPAAGNRSSSSSSSSSGFSLSTVFAIACAVLSLICLISISSLKGELNQLRTEVNGQLNQVSASYSGVQDALENVSESILTAQQQAYTQLAEQNISITKDLTSLTGPVAQGKYNQMFIINAQGNLNLDTSFDWQRYNPTSGGWSSIVFTGSATSNEEYGLRIENRLEKDGTYISILWANGITLEGEGTYRCVVKDINGITKTSSEAEVKVAPAPVDDGEAVPEE